MKKTLPLLAVAFIAALPGPLLAQSRQDQQMAASLLMIQEQQQQTALAVAQLAEIVTALTPRFDGVVEAMRKQMAGLEATIRNVGPEISAIRSQSQENGTRIGTLKDEIDALSRTMTDLLREISKLQVPGPAAVVDPAAPPVSQGAVAPPPAQTVTVPAGAGLQPGRLLDESKGEFFGGRYALALAGFEQVVKLFPTTQAAAEAQLMIGDTHAADSPARWTEAIAAYNAVIQRYPKSTFVADAYFRRGVAELRVGQSEAATKSFEYAATNFPETDSGRLARQRLPPTRPAK